MTVTDSLHISSIPLQLSGVTKCYKQKNVIQDISFQLDSGEIFGLIGLNGVGKTTLIKAMLDLITVDSGTIDIYGYSSKNVQSRQRVSYLPEKFQPSFYLKGIEHLSLTLSYFDKKLVPEKAYEMVDALDLDPKMLNERVGSYSKGMGQKLGLAGAFLLDLPLLILDEPMSGLDPSVRIKLKKVLIEQKEAGKTILFSSHILADIDEICDRIGIIHDARLQYIGTPEAFKEEQEGENSLERAFIKKIDS